MHESSMKRMGWFVKTFPKERTKYKVLDVGSYDVNGTYKALFDNEKFDYEGLDMEEGPNVDIVPAMIYRWDEIEDNTYDIVISGQALEHIEFFWLTVKEMVRVTKKDGYICIIAPNGFKEHRYPVDCWRFFTDGMVALANYYELEILHAHTNAAPTIKEHEWYSHDCADSIIVARKRYEGNAKTVDIKDYKCIPSDHKSLRDNFIDYNEYKAAREEMKQQLETKESVEGKTIRGVIQPAKFVGKVKAKLGKLFKRKKDDVYTAF